MVMSLPSGDKSLLVFLLLVFWLCPMACRTLVLQPGMEPAPPAVEVQNPNHWTASEVTKNLNSQNIG